MRAEEALLLGCARTQMDSERREQVGALAREELDWPRLLRVAEQHGVGLLLCRSLSNTCPQAVPSAAMEHLRALFHAHAQRNLFLTRELLRLVRLLEAQGIPAVPFKGPVLAAAAYGDLSLRQTKDLDILVPRRDLRRAREALAAAGYCPNHALSPAQQAVHERDDYATKLLRADPYSVVELHWSFRPRYLSFRLDPAGVIERRQPLSLPGGTVRHPAPEDLLLILCAHGAGHFWDRLLWIGDVAELIRAHPALDWKRVREQARDSGSERMLLLGLMLARDLLDAALPVEIERRLQADRAVAWLATHVKERLFRETPPAFREAEKMQERAYLLRIRERWRDRIGYCLHLASDFIPPSPADRAALPLPAPLAPLYLLLRPARLASKYGRLLFARGVRSRLRG